MPEMTVISVPMVCTILADSKDISESTLYIPYSNCAVIDHDQDVVTVEGSKGPDGV
jgi:hypothetical protein